MIKLNRKANCCGCQACAQVCPKGCITMQPDEEGFLYPAVDVTACIRCGLCEQACPELHSTHVGETAPVAYAAYNQNEEIRLESSSGGVFSLLAEQVLNQNGVVYGAALEQGYVRHVRVAEKDGLKRLRGSKYVQSDIGNTFLQTKEDLQTGKQVLFTGTPCQIEGLKAFLRKEYDNLICMDLVCHGVPSPIVWEKYLKRREQKAGAQIEDVSFRHKRYGWETSSMKIRFTNNKVYHRKRQYDLFNRAFLSDLCLRPACYQCSFKKISRVSDVTVADFWGIDEICPDMNDDKGISLVILHSHKGKRLFEVISKDLIWREVDLESAINCNRAMIKSSKMPEARQEFMKRVQTESLEDLIPQFTRRPFNLKAEVKFLAKRMLNCVGLLKFAKKVKKRIKGS